MNASSQVDRHSDYNKGKLFLISVLALATAGVGFAIRGGIASDLQSHFFDPIDKLRSAEMVATALGVVFLGFAFTIAIGSPLLDFLGMGRLLGLSSLSFIVGTLIVIFADHLASGPSIYWAVWSGMLVIGIGQGLVETVINPLAATLYPDDKTHKLNVLHAWWPGGIIIGGLLGLALGQMNLGWEIKLGIVIIPAAAFGIMLLGTRFPPSERVAAGISTSEMFKELVRPFFVVWFLSMFLTAAAELAPGQWVDLALTRTVGMQGIWLLIYVSGLMFVMRHFAGPMAHRLSPVGLLWFSCLLASAGLLAVEHRQFTHHGFVGCHRVGHGCLLYVAHHAGCGFRAVPAWRCIADGAHGDCRHFVDLLRAADDGPNLRPCKDPGSRRRRSIQEFDRRWIESGVDGCGSNVLSLRSDSSGHSVGRVWSYLDLRQV